ncbi:Immunoglobulin V-set domain [Nesidiocoris tenuis]|uniref:Immunoglobulin V-set domain n=2 Tax=Nesidiocoris tenuis TaxID=355587 RepID=A0ABN7AZG4_9HEMI|nr:Immunoglobulin V-set domain [Nesidiocoris tenuis]
MNLGLPTTMVVYGQPESYKNVIFSSLLCLQFIWLPSVLSESLQAPRIITQPSSSNSFVSEGRTKILQCQALGYPQPQYKWFKDGVELSDFTTENFFRIVNTRREDGGTYVCMAKNDVGAILSKKIDITVAYMGVFEDLVEKTVTVDAGEAAIIDLPKIDSHPAPLVQWQVDDGSNLYAREFALSPTNQLIILSANPSHQKAYRAHATNTQLGKEENSGYIRLRVVDDGTNSDIAPQLIIAPQDVHIVKGQPETKLHCIVNARPLHELETLWYKDGILIENVGVAYTFNDPWNRTLSLVSANLTHTGQYTCQASLRSAGYPAVKATANVAVSEVPSFVGNMRPETLAEYGSTVVLPCEAIGVPAPNITWLCNGYNVMTLPQSEKYRIEEDGSLVIKKLKVEDTGMLQCVASNEAGSESVATWLKVKTSAPVLETPPQNATVLDGKDVIMTCRVFGSPIPNTTWIYGENQVVGITGRIQVLESGDLLIAAVKESDAGKYTCVRTNEAGRVDATGYLTVLVRTQIIQPPVDTKVLLGNTATLQCKVSSDPTVPYQIDWFHNTRSVGYGTQRVKIGPDGTLVIHAVRAADVGDYTCMLSSAGGNETRTARLSVIELPYPVMNVKAERFDQRVINVSWTPAFDGNSQISKYIIQRREVSDIGLIADPLLNWITEDMNVSADARSVVLTNLKAASSYQFRVSAVNSVGEGMPSEPSNIITLPQEPPSGPPLGFAGSARSSSEIITQWQPPLEEHRNGQILGYIIRYRLWGYNHSPWTQHNVTNEAQRNFLIQDLITWKDYILQIAAYNNKGVGVYSDGLKIKTKEGVPEAPPGNVVVEPYNSTAVKVSWKPPNPQKINGINQGYKILAYQGSKVKHSLTVPPSLLDPLEEQKAIMAGLDKFSTYNFTVLCFTDPGDGVQSPPIEITTLEDVPDEVGVLQFEDISDRAVKVVWSTPPHPNGILTGYTLTYCVKGNPNTLKTENLSSNTTSINIEQLQATTHYRFSIAAKTSVGVGVPREATILSGVEPVLPLPPTKLAVTNIEPFSVVLQFTPGFDGNSSITKYVVEAKTARNSSWFAIQESYQPDGNTVTVVGLTPFTMYMLRLIASNVVGDSVPSAPTKEFQTIQAPPAHSPRNVTVRAMSATELRVRWIPLQQVEWFGNPRGYNITYSEWGTSLTKSITIEDHTANSHILHNLEEFTQYQIAMSAFNDVGSSEISPPALERTRESVPSFGPMDVEANTTSSTTIVVKWGDVPREHRNGQIEGFKVFYGGVRNQGPKVKDIPSNKTFTTTLTELRKFQMYSIQVLAYTRLGDGVLSTPPITVQTFEDVPGAPSNVSFPDVSLSTARIIWDEPDEPNGEIIAYRISYRLQQPSYAASSGTNFSREFPPSDRTYRVTELEAEQYYIFAVSAQTRLGWGKSATAIVYTTNNREAPEPPSKPQISRSQLQATQITFSWTPGRDGYAPLRYYTVDVSEGVGPWIGLMDRLDPQVTSFTAVKLKPFTLYRFRIQATNDIGPSGWSPESAQVRTLPAAPSTIVSGLRVIPITTTSVEVNWLPIPMAFWSGDDQTGGYRIMFQPLSDFPTSLQATPKLEVQGAETKQVVLTDLTRDRNYEIVIAAFNAQGVGPPSTPVTVYVGEAVPTGQPLRVNATPISPTEIRVSWTPPQSNMQNGDLLGYKIFYLMIESPQELGPEEKIEEETEVVPASYTSHSLVFLDKYTLYKIQILAFNPAGDGPRSVPVTVRTMQGLPGPPRNIRFSEITMTSLIVSWDPPKKRNGELIGYIVTYETAEQNDRFSKQVKQKVTEPRLEVQTLEEEVSYTFVVRAETTDYGPPIRANVTTGPQDGSPSTPRAFTIGKTVSSVEMHWANSASGKGPILGYYIQSKRKDDTRWTTVTRTGNGPLTEFGVSYQNLLPSTSYNFRLIAYNKFGISYPVYSDDTVLTPSKLYLEYGYLQMKPFYRQTWFMVLVAASSIVIIIMVIAVLCVKSKSYKYKQEAQKTLEESMAMDLDDRQELAMEVYRGKRNGTLGRSHPAPVLAKSPPRPSPASVAYHSDDESLKAYDENPDDSSLTEKPSEISSSDSQGSESENESVRSDPHSFVNHYANVNDSLRQSWKRQKPVRNYSSYTDSEPEGSAVVSLNGGQIIMNNMARSRAPLPGFSSFV